MTTSKRKAKKSIIVNGKRQRYNGVMCADISDGQETQAIPAMNLVDTSPVRVQFPPH
eukprot:SAG31_NODE_6182_length_2134_cov_1.482064_3_plen_57_part_00